MHTSFHLRWMTEVPSWACAVSVWSSSSSLAGVCMWDLGIIVLSMVCGLRGCVDGRTGFSGRVLFAGRFNKRFGDYCLAHTSLWNLGLTMSWRKHLVVRSYFARLSGRFEGISSTS